MQHGTNVCAFLVTLSVTKYSLLVVVLTWGASCGFKFGTEVEASAAVERLAEGVGLCRKILPSLHLCWIDQILSPKGQA